MPFPVDVKFLSVQIPKYRFISLKYDSSKRDLRKRLFALKFFTTPQQFKTKFSSVSSFAYSHFFMENLSFVCLSSGRSPPFVLLSFLEREESFPLEDGLRVVIPSPTFFNEFFLTNEGFLISKVFDYYSMDTTNIFNNYIIRGAKSAWTTNSSFL